MSMVQESSKTRLRNLTSQHLTNISVYLLPTQPSSAAFLGRKILARTDLPRKRRKARGTSPARPARTESTPKVQPPPSANLCPHCGVPLVPGYNVRRRLEAIPSSKQTRELKGKRNSERSVRKSKRRRPEWGPKKGDEAASERDGGGENEERRLWFATRELKDEYEAARREGRDWAKRVEETMERWNQSGDAEAAKREAEEARSGELGTKEENEKEGRGEERKRPKRRVLTCEHCDAVMRQPLTSSAKSAQADGAPAKQQDVDKQMPDPTAPAELAATTKAKEAPKPQSDAAKAKARAKLRKQGALAGLLAKNRAKEANEKKETGLNLMDFMKSA